MMSQEVLIVGSGMAGYTLARELRKLAPEAPMALVTADGGEVYSNPCCPTLWPRGWRRPL